MNNRIEKLGRTQKNAGFTLLEILIALSVIAIVLITVYRLHAQTIAISSRSRFYATAPLLAQHKLAEINTLNSLSSGSGSFSESFPGYRWEASLSEVESETLGAGAKTLKRVDVRITLNETEYIYDLRTYRHFWE